MHVNTTYLHVALLSFQSCIIHTLAVFAVSYFPITKSTPVNALLWFGTLHTVCCININVPQFVFMNSIVIASENVFA